MKRKAFIITVLLFLIIVFAGCTSQDNKPSETTVKPSSSEESPSGSQSAEGSASESPSESPSESQSPSESPSESQSPSSSPSGSQSGSQQGSQQPNAWVVKEVALVKDSDTGKDVGTAYKGFAISMENAKGNQAVFQMSFMDEKGSKVQTTKNYIIDTKNMEKKYVEPQAVILMISTDMISIKAGGTLKGADGKKLIMFDEKQGPLFYIQKTEKGYMFTLDLNVVYADQNSAEVKKIK